MYICTYTDMYTYRHKYIFIFRYSGISDITMQGSFLAINAAPSSMPSPSTKKTENNVNSDGEIVGGVIGGVVFILIIIGLICYMRRRKSRTLISNTPTPALAAPIDEGQRGNEYLNIYLCIHIYICMNKCVNMHIYVYKYL
jgi:hypothetical protein